VRLDHGRSDPRVLRELANSQEPQDKARKAATDIRDDARSLAPKKTGRLARHIVIEEITDIESGLEGYAVGWDDAGFYGQFVEDGTERTRPQPHLVPAAIKNGAVSPGGDA
jgi:HK97 gp10 family phage protein